MDVYDGCLDKGIRIMSKERLHAQHRHAPAPLPQPDLNPFRVGV